jgi:hypothetical protein
VAVAIAAGLPGAPGAVAKPRAPSVTIVTYRVLRARLAETVSFRGDGGPQCQRAGLCGYSGSVSYVFDRLRFGIAEMFSGSALLNSSSVVVLIGRGITRAAVTNGVPAQTTIPLCTDSLVHGVDAIELKPVGRRILASFHNLVGIYGPDYLRTRCPGPLELDVAHHETVSARLLPASLLRHRSTRLSWSATRAFHHGGFVGTVSVAIDLKLGDRQRSVCTSTPSSDPPTAEVGPTSTVCVALSTAVGSAPVPTAGGFTG